MADHIFLSYAHEDRPRVDSFVDLLRQKGWEVYVDDQIRGGHQWPDELHKAIRTSHAFVVMLSPDAMHSQHILNEINVALGTNRAIIPVMLEDTVLTPGVELLIGSRQIVDYSDASTWQFDDVDSAITQAVDRPPIRQKSRGMGVMGNVITGLGAFGIVSGMGLFLFTFYQGVTGDSLSLPEEGRQVVGAAIIFFIGVIFLTIGAVIKGD